MEIQQPGIYHIYNRSIDKQCIFPRSEDYHNFLNRCHGFIKPCSNILAWCLMPTHFHFLLEITEISLLKIKQGGNTMPAIVNSFKQLQSSYCKHFNFINNRTGNLFQQKAKAKLIEFNTAHLQHAFWYIHNNRVKDRMVRNMSDWEFSSYQDFAGIRNGKLCNVEKAKRILDLSDLDFKI